jgi:hypothetical protein
VETDASSSSTSPTGGHRHYHRSEGRLKRHNIVDTLVAPLHRRHNIAKVYINVVFIDIFVNTPPPHNIVHMMDTKLRHPLTVQLQGTMPALTVPRHRRWH